MLALTTSAQKDQLLQQYHLIAKDGDYSEFFPDLEHGYIRRPDAVTKQGDVNLAVYDGTDDARQYAIDNDLPFVTLHDAKQDLSASHLIYDHTEKLYRPAPGYERADHRTENKVNYATVKKPTETNKPDPELVKTHDDLVRERQERLQKLYPKKDAALLTAWAVALLAHEKNPDHEGQI